MSISFVVIIGAILGSLVTYILMKMRENVDGYLRIDTSDHDDNPYLFLEVSSSISEIRKKKYVTFEVNTENYISQK